MKKPTPTFTHVQNKKTVKEMRQAAGRVEGQEDSFT